MYTAPVNEANVTKLSNEQLLIAYNDAIYKNARRVKPLYSMEQQEKICQTEILKRMMQPSMF